jgi:hypothetical protein
MTTRIDSCTGSGTAVPGANATWDHAAKLNASLAPLGGNKPWGVDVDDGWTNDMTIVISDGKFSFYPGELQ